MLGADQNEPVIYHVIDDGTMGGKRVPSNIELAFEEIRVQAASGEILSRGTRGSLTLETWQRTAVPAYYADASEPYLYHENATTEYLEDGRQQHVYRIFREPNIGGAEKALTPAGPPRVSELVWEKWAEAGENDELFLTATISGFPDLELPPVPPRELFSEMDIARALDMQTEVLERRRVRFEEILHPIQMAIEAAGGSVLGRFPDTGSFHLAIPQGQLPVLLDHPSLAAIGSSVVPNENTACGNPGLLNCSGNPQWLLGEGRRANRLDADKFLNAGIDGSITNPRHGGLPRLQAGIVEMLMLEDESRALLDGNLSSRLISKWDCSVDPCQFITNYFDDVSFYQWWPPAGFYWLEDDNARHGTMVSSVIASDFRQGQADDLAFGDPTYVGTGDHCANWVNASTGMAPGVSVNYANAAQGQEKAYSRAYAKMRHHLVDVLNLSHSVGTECNISSRDPHENELENGYDQGLTIIASAGNREGGNDCRLASPADTPKVLAVTGLDCANAFCIANYQNCPLSGWAAATGGMNAKINGITYSRIIAGVDLAAPQSVFNVTWQRDLHAGDGPWLQTNGVPAWPEGWNHSCSFTNPIPVATGTSTAALHVVGLALLLKHWQLFKGNLFFNNPGRLQALVLAMADRWDPDHPAGRRTMGVSRRTGFGRVKLRHLDNPNFWPAAFQGHSVHLNSGSSSLTSWVWSAPTPPGTNFVKCVLFEAEDMSHKDHISDIYLQVNLRNPDGQGNCSANSTFWGGVVDSSRDIRHMVALENSVANKCVEYQLHKRHATSVGVTVHMFCYRSSRNDHENVAD